MIKNLSKDDFRYLSQAFDNDLFNLVKPKGFYPYKYISDFEKFKKEFPSKEMSFSSLSREITNKEHERILNVWKKFEMKTIKNYHKLYLKCNVLLLVDVF